MYRFFFFPFVRIFYDIVGNVLSTIYHKSLYLGILDIVGDYGGNTFAYSDVLVNIDEVIYIDNVEDNRGRMIAIRNSENKAFILIDSTTYEIITCDNNGTCSSVTCDDDGTCSR